MFCSDVVLLTMTVWCADDAVQKLLLKVGSETEEKEKKVGGTKCFIGSLARKVFQDPTGHSHIVTVTQKRNSVKHRVDGAVLQSVPRTPGYSRWL